MTHIQSLNLDYNGEIVITDIDNCLIDTDGAIREWGLTRYRYWFNEQTYQANKYNVTMSANITNWGREFLDLINNGTIQDYKLFTVGGDRADILEEKLTGINTMLLFEDMQEIAKAAYLNRMSLPTIYVDDRKEVSKLVYNKNVKCITIS